MDEVDQQERRRRIEYRCPYCHRIYEIEKSAWICCQREKDNVI